MRYNDEEYKSLIKKEAGWSREETDYLLDMAARYELRFVAIADRYEVRRGGDSSMGGGGMWLHVARLCGQCRRVRWRGCRWPCVVCMSCGGGSARMVAVRCRGGGACGVRQAHGQLYQLSFLPFPAVPWGAGAQHRGPQGPLLLRRAAAAGGARGRAGVCGQQHAGEAGASSAPAQRQLSATTSPQQRRLGIVVCGRHPSLPTGRLPPLLHSSLPLHALPRAPWLARRPLRCQPPPWLSACCPAAAGAAPLQPAARAEAQARAGAAHAAQPGAGRGGERDPAARGADRGQAQGGGSGAARGRGALRGSGAGIPGPRCACSTRGAPRALQPGHVAAGHVWPGRRPGPLASSAPSLLLFRHTTPALAPPPPAPTSHPALPPPNPPLHRSPSSQTRRLPACRRCLTRRRSPRSPRRGRWRGALPRGSSWRRWPPSSWASE